ncbi:MAG: Hsp20 family protein [Bryobacteraceae bacterium]
MNQNIQPVRLDKAAPPTILGEIEGVFDRIRNRAYELFTRRGATNGSDLDDWLLAERELFSVPLSELKETDRDYTLEIAAPGFEPNEIQVAVEPGSVTIRGKAERRQDRKGQKTVYSEWSAKELFRHFDFTASIDTDAVKASIEAGLLRVSMPKKLVTEPDTATAATAAKAA